MADPLAVVITDPSGYDIVTDGTFISAPLPVTITDPSGHSIDLTMVVGATGATGATGPQDFPGVINAFAIDGAITLASGVAFLTKTSASAMTLAAPAVDQDGVTLRVVAATAHAHVITCASFFNGDGVTNTATFGGAVGDAFTLVAKAQKWLAVELHNVTLSAV